MTPLDLYEDATDTARDLPWLMHRLPAYLVSGTSVGLGLALMTALVAAWAGLPAAMAMSSGFAAVSVADTPVTPRAKWLQMLPAVIGSALVAFLVTAVHVFFDGNVWLLGAVALAVTFCAVMWMAWGKRGGPQTFVLILTLVFQMASHTSLAPQGRDAWAHLGWVVIGGSLMALWALTTNLLLAPRYRTLALAACLEAVARLIRAQADWVDDLLEDGEAGVGEASAAPLMALVNQQATIAEPLQQARDLLYSLRPGAPQLPLAAALVRVVDMRDQVLACQLDLDELARSHEGRAALPHFARAMRTLATDLDSAADALQLGRGLPPPQSAQTELLAMIATAEAEQARRSWPSPLSGIVMDGHPAPTAPEGAQPLRTGPAPVALVRALIGRVRHIGHAREQVAAALSGRDAKLPIGLDGLSTFVSASHWPLAALRQHMQPRSPILRYALRATLAMACAYGLGMLLPWGSHKHWLLMTVAVVMRGSLEQTLLRRNARVIGTLAGCILVTALLALPQSHWLLFGTLAVALALAHAYALVDYRVTSAAAAVQALLQSHMLAAGNQVMHMAAFERLADTLIGAGIAWAFSYVLPAWEREQLPIVLRRLIRAQAAYAREVLSLHKPAASDAAWRVARREVYDALWLLTQTLQRMSREPQRVRAAARRLEMVLVHSHRLTSHLAAVKTLITVRRGELDPAVAGPALAQAEEALMHALRIGAGDDAAAPADLAAEPSIGELPTDPGIDPTPWLQRRLRLAVDEAAQMMRCAGLMARLGPAA